MKNPFKKEKKNLNTEEYWDKDFNHEWDTFENGNNAAFDYDWRWDSLRFNTIAIDIPFKGGKLLEIGCGLGHFLRYLKARNINIDATGLDFSKAGLKHAKALSERTGIKMDLVHGDAQQLPFEDNSFDYVVSQETVEHLSDPKKHIQEMRRVVRPGGSVYISTPWRGLINKTDPVMSKEHVQEWTPEEFIKFVEPEFKQGRIVIPPILVDRVKQEPVVPWWFLLKVTKEDD